MSYSTHRAPERAFDTASLNANRCTTQEVWGVERTRGTEIRLSTTQDSQINWQISAHAWGTPDSFRFALAGTPYLSDHGIALLLAVGATQTVLAQFRSDKTSIGAAYGNQTANSPSHRADIGVDLKWRLEFD